MKQAPAPNEVQQSVEHLFRHESGKMLAVLVKLFGLHQTQVAEDIVQETLLTAYETWELKGLPDNPRAWLYRAAKNKTIDFLRRERNFKDKIAPNMERDALARADTTRWVDHLFADAEIEDAQLRMMFACCHPALSVEQQLGLMLRTLCGLNTAEIATAFMLPEDTVTKRLKRAKEKIKSEHIQLEVPVGQELLPRLDAVLQAIYLLFNEGYKATADHALIRRDLCQEALRLGGLLCSQSQTNLPKTHALQSLMCFQASRFDARLDEHGDIILLEHQDRATWNKALIQMGYQHLQWASKGETASEYHIEAGIASYHATAPSFEQTNWKAIFYCYELLQQISPSSFVALNRAIALGYAEGAQRGIMALLAIQDLQKNYLYHVALGNFYQKEKDTKAALDAYHAALNLVVLPAEKRLIEGKIAKLGE